MPFPKSAASKGGKAPASAHQKAIARLTIRETQPWTQSTGAKSQGGKAIACQNSMQASLKWRFRGNQVNDFAETLKRCQGILEEFDRIAERFTFQQSDCSFRVVLHTKVAHGNDQRGDWAAIAVRVETIAQWKGDEENPPLEVGQSSELAWKELNLMLDTGRSILPAAKVNL